MKVTGVEKVNAKLESYSIKKQSAIKKVVANSGLTVQRNAMKRVPADTGHLRRSIRTDFSNGGFTAVVKTAVNYAAYVEFGTSPHFPPPSALKGWAKRHGMAGKESLIARAIARKGTPAQPYLFPSYEQERPRFLAKVAVEMRKT